MCENRAVPSSLSPSPPMRLFVAIAAVATAVAQSTTPQQIHIALAGRDEAGLSNGASFSWATPVATATSTVWYGTSPNNLTASATGDSVSYLAVRARIWPVARANLASRPPRIPCGSLTAARVSAAVPAPPRHCYGHDRCHTVLLQGWG